MWIPPEGWLLIIGFVTFFLGYMVGFGAGQSSGKAEALEQAYGVENVEEKED
jgi:hypothetical protein